MSFFPTPNCGSLRHVVDEDESQSTNVAVPMKKVDSHSSSSTNQGSKPKAPPTLEQIMREDAEDKMNLIFLEQKGSSEKRKQYTDEEVKMLKKRSFKSRLFMTCESINRNTVFLRTHFSDNHTMESVNTLNYVRDYFKAAHGTQSHTAAKAALARIIIIALDGDESWYKSLACVLASGLSGKGENTDFEKCPQSKNHQNVLVRDNDNLPETREEYCKLMHIIFSKIKKYRFMIDEEGSNAYRLCHCRTATTKDKSPLLYAGFSFLLQTCLTGYVIAQLYINVNGDTYDNLSHIMKNLPLALLTLFYSTVLATPELKGIPDAYGIFGNKFGVLQMMDFIVNAILPSLLIISGFFVILGQDEFIEAVLNTAALLFIPEIDDQLPSLLGFDQKSIVKNFLIHEAMREYDDFVKQKCREMEFRKSALRKTVIDSTAFESLKSMNAFHAGAGVEFGDYFITNWSECGSSPGQGALFQPYQIRKGNDMTGDRIEPSCYVTEDCLVKKLTWQYTVWNNTTEPRIGYMMIEMLNGQVLELTRPKEDSIKLGEPETLEGVFIITTFQMSNDVLRLRACGSKTAQDFKQAFDYYTLWPLSKKATKKLDQIVHAEWMEEKKEQLKSSLASLSISPTKKKHHEKLTTKADDHV